MAEPLKVLTKIHPPFVNKLENGKYEGFLIDIWDSVADELGVNFTYHEHRTSRNILDNVIDGNGSIGLADFSINFYSKNESVSDSIEFTPPTLITGFGAAFYIEQKSVSNTIMLLVSTFSWEVWLSILAMFLINSSAFFFYTKLNRGLFHSSSSYIDENYGFIESLWFSAGTWLRQGTDHRPKTLPLRLIATGWYLFCLVFVSIYTAKLASTLTAQSIQYPLNYVNELPIQQSIQYGTKGKILKDFFDELKTESAAKEIWPMMKRWNTTRFNSWTDLEEHAKQHRGKFAMIRRKTHLESQAAKEPNCDLFVLEGTLNNDYLGIALSKQLPENTRRAISNEILHLARTGLLQNWKAQHWQTEACNGVRAKGKSQDGGLGIEYFLGVFLVVALFYLISLASFTLEWVHTRNPSGSSQKVG